MFTEIFKMNSVKLFENIALQNSRTNFFLLCDTAKNYLYIRRWLQQLSIQEIKQIGNLFEGTIDESTPLEFSPLLIPITFIKKNEIQKQLLIEDNIEMFSVIETSLSKQELIHHLQPFLQAEMPTGELALFRFYDPSITQILDKILDKQEYQNLLKPIKNWWFQEPNNTFQNLVSD